jgi:hypothetical protein
VVTGRNIGEHGHVQQPKEMKMEFKDLKIAVSNQFDAMNGNVLFRTGISKDELWDLYLRSFPAGADPVYLERTEHDCSACKQFIRAVGNMAMIKDGQIVTIWDIEVGGDYQVVADAMAAESKAAGIVDFFLHTEKSAGIDKNRELLDNGTVNVWEHLYVKLPKRYVDSGDNIGTRLNSVRTGVEVFTRALNEITHDAVATVIELIDQKSLYRGEEHLAAVKEFYQHKEKYLGLTGLARDLYAWSMINANGFTPPVFGIRNNVIGTLLVDLSEGKDLEFAVNAFEKKVAPENYKRSSALITQSMIDRAQETIVDLGFETALQRRYAVTEDITVNNVLFAHRDTKPKMSGPLGDLKPTTGQSMKNLDKVEEVSIQDFIDNILPKAESLELMVENRHANNMVSLIAPVDPDALNMLKWPNNFSWNYNGEVTDSLKDRVKELGGRVDGALRFTHTWNYDGQNQSLMDLHVFMPGSGEHPTGSNDRYPNGRRVGWNQRNDHASGGVQDVDFVNPPGKNIPVENITFPSVDKMPEGLYRLKVHNWKLRQPTRSGFRAEIEFGGQIFSYDYPKSMGNKEWVDVAEITLKNGEFTIKHMLPESATSREIWGLASQQFHPVTMLMNSPNHWDDQASGNKHYFFMLDKCVNTEPARGFYNEFLCPTLHDHRKVFEVLGSKMKTVVSLDQLSGLGFSTTQRNSVLCKVKGSFTRTIKINF